MRSASFAACFAALAILVSTFPSHAAGARARAQCKGKDCKVVTSFRKTCAAFAIDAKNACGPNGWAKAGSLAHAQNIAAEQCHRFGGRTCVIRAWVCDQKG